MSMPPPPPPISPPPGYQPYGTPYGGPPRSHGKATASLVCGIIGIFICPIVLSLLAVVFGFSSKNEIDATPGVYSNRTSAVAGSILGIIGLALIPVWWIVIARTR